MKTLFTVLKKIVWKDIFKPRYILVVTIYEQAALHVVDGKLKFSGQKFRKPCIMDRPYKRDLSTPFNVFYNELSDQGMVIAGSKRTFSKLYGIGSCLPHNLNNPNHFYPSMRRTG